MTNSVLNSYFISRPNVGKLRAMQEKLEGLDGNDVMTV